jgi:hypothetical protein
MLLTFFVRRGQKMDILPADEAFVCLFVCKTGQAITPARRIRSGTDHIMCGRGAMTKTAQSGKLVWRGAGNGQDIGKVQRHGKHYQRR